MDNIMNRWYAATKKRSSVRSYNNATFDKQDCFALKEFAGDIATDEARLVLFSDPGILKAPFFLPSVKGTKYSAAVVAKKNARHIGGYVGEAFVLECTANDFGTCWLASSYNRILAKKQIGLAKDECLIGVISFGISTNPLKANTENKKTPQQLAMCRNAEEYSHLLKWQQKAMECVALAPSAMNKQEWEFEFSNDSLKLYLTSNNRGMADVDCGIAMLHVELGVSQCGITGNWSYEDGSPVFTIV